MAITERASTIYSPGYVIGNGGSDIDAAITDEFYKKMPVIKNYQQKKSVDRMQ